MVPEAYRQKFRQQRKPCDQTYLGFAREKGIIFDKWCLASKANDYDSLCELMLLEDFENCIPEHVVLYLNKQKVAKLENKIPDPCFEPFIFDGLVSLTSDPPDRKPVSILGHWRIPDCHSL